MSIQRYRPDTDADGHLCLMVRDPAGLLVRLEDHLSTLARLADEIEAIVDEHRDYMTSDLRALAAKLRKGDES